MSDGIVTLLSHSFSLYIFSFFSYRRESKWIFWNQVKKKFKKKKKGEEEEEEEDDEEEERARERKREWELDLLECSWMREKKKIKEERG